MNTTGMLPDGTFENKVILITGGGTGLGKSMGNYLIKLGAKLIITSRKIEVIQKTADEFNNQYENSTIAIQGDVRKIEDVKNVIEQGVSEFGNIDILVTYDENTNPYVSIGKIYITKQQPIILQKSPTDTLSANTGSNVISATPIFDR